MGTYIKESIIRNAFHAGGKRISKSGMAEIDAKVDRIIKSCCLDCYNSHKIVDAELVLFVSGTRRER